MADHRNSKADLYEKMIANMGEVIVIIDSLSRIKYESPNGEKFFGWKQEELIGRDYLCHIYPEDIPRFQEFHDRLLEDADSEAWIECRYLCRNGDVKWIEFTGKNMFSDRDIRGILGNFHDISIRKRTEVSLQESEERFKALHNASFGGITIHDKGVILDCNKGLSDITGYTVEELIGMDGLLLIAEHSRDLVMGNILNGYEEPYEAVGLRKNGEEYPIRLAAKNIPYRGKPTRVVEFRDISDQKKAEKEKKELEDQLMQAQKLESVGRLAGGVAHDFNNMLGIIIGFSELSLNSLEEDSPLREYLGEILDAAERSMEISAQLLAFARKQTIKPSVIDINRTIENMLKMLKRLIGENISLNWHPGSGCRPVRIDPAQMNQILANLSVNARDAISDVGVITISTENVLLEREKSGVPPGEYVRLTFTDSGQGMTEEVRQNIFEPFYTTKQAGKGTGLGLSTVYGIVKQNGGCIGVDSSPGKGTTFSIHFPPAESIPDSETVPPPLRETPRASDHELILLVEDEPGMRSMVSAMLRELDYEVLTAETPEHAIEMAAKEGSRIDLLLTDVIMPSMNGRDLAQRISALLPGMKVLYMSGYTSDVIGKDGIIEEDILYIQKPFSRQHLAVTLWEILQKDPP